VVAKAHRRSAAIHRAFVSRNVDLLVRAYLRRLVEHNCVIWSPFTVKDIETIESVQRRFTKRLPGLNCSSYAERLKRVHLHRLELRRLYTDLFYCYRILFGLVDLQASDFFQWAPCQNTRGHKFKLYKKNCSTQVRSTLLRVRVVNVWNSLPASVDFS